MRLFRIALFLNLLSWYPLFCSAQLSVEETTGDYLAHLSPESQSATAVLSQRVSVAVGMERQIFPAYVLATASLAEKNDAYTLGEGDGQVAVFVRNPAAHSSVRIEVAATPFSDAAVFEGKMAEAGREYEITPRLPWHFQKLRALGQPTPINFTVTTFVNDEKVSRRTIVATLRSVNDCPYYWEEKGNQSGDLDLNYMYVAYINEDDPVVDQILTQALQTDIVDGFDGYQMDDKKRVDDQVFSIWYAMQKRGIRYSSISTNSSTGVSPYLYSQRIRTIDQTWQNKQANCVDAMVLLASVLRSIHIDPVLILTADHCVLGYYRDEQHQDLACLEASMIGDLDLRKVATNRRLKASRKLFTDARQRAQQHYLNAKPYLADNDPRYRFIEVSDVRKSGIRPIGR